MVGIGRHQRLRAAAGKSWVWVRPPLYAPLNANVIGIGIHHRLRTDGSVMAVQVRPLSFAPF